VFEVYHRQKKGPARGQPALSSKFNARGSVESQYENDIRGNVTFDSIDPFGSFFKIHGVLKDIPY
jgi:hypothetical protein